MLLILTVVAALITRSSYFVAANWGDPPELQAQEDLLYAFGTNETYIMETLKLPQITSNVGMEKWMYGRPPEVEASTTILSPSEEMTTNISVSSGNKDNQLYVFVSVGRYMIMEAVGPSLHNWTIVQDMKDIVMYDETFGNNGRKAGGSDYRIYPYNGHYRVAFDCSNPDNTALQDQCYMDLNFDKNSYSLYVLSQSVRYFNIDHEMGKGQQQKNWSPFTVRMETKFNNLVMSSYDKNLFIYSAKPHRIIHGNESSFFAATGDSPIRVTKAFTVCNTEVDNVDEAHPFWAWGSVRGGTPAVLLLDTPFGSKYMTVFHSQSRGPKPASWLLSYYMGAYLFDTEPPFAITHMTPDPIIPHVLYDERTSGWAFKAIDYIIFPVGLTVDKDMAYVSLGRNDNTGYMVSLNLTTLFRTGLRPMHSKTLRNIFVNHIMHNDGQDGEDENESKDKDDLNTREGLANGYGTSTDRRMTQTAIATIERKATMPHHHYLSSSKSHSRKKSRKGNKTEKNGDETEKKFFSALRLRGSR